MSEAKTFQIPHLWCPNCLKTMFAITVAEAIEGFFSGSRPPCPSCEKPLDAWEMVLHLIKGAHSPSIRLSAINARTTVIPISLTAHCVTDVRFADHGVPEDARILAVWYAPMGLPPLEVPEGHEHPRHFIPSKVSLYTNPRDFSYGADAHQQVWVAWLPTGSDDLAEDALADALEALLFKRLKSAIVPANLAVEITVARLVRTWLSKVSSKKHVDPFLRDKASYSHQLNVLLPALVDRLGAPQLPDDIRGLLNRLRDLRNNVAHTGATEEPLEYDEVATCLCAAFFGFHYAKVVEKMLLNAADRLATR